MLRFVFLSSVALYSSVFAKLSEFYVFKIVIVKKQ